MDKKFKFALLDNGLDSIASAVEHLKDGSKRSLKRAVRDLWQGVELVFKERLHREHWSLVFENVNKADKATYDSGDFTSVGFDACVERLQGICGVAIAPRDLAALKSLQKKRGRLEHFGIDMSYEAVAGSAVSALEIIVEFIHRHLDDKTLDEEAATLVEEIMRGARALDDYVEERWKKINAHVKAAKTAVVTCSDCTQDALVINGGGVECLFCHYEADSEEAASDYVERVLGTSHKERADFGLCPECDYQLVVDLQNGGNQYPAIQYVCFNCGESFMERSFTDCSSCGRPFRDDEDGVGVCKDCWDQMVNDDD